MPKRWEFLFAQRHEGAVPHTLLALNHESRTEPLKCYTISQQPRGYSVAFDPKRDTIYNYGFTLGHFRVQFRAFPSCNQDTKSVYGNVIDRIGCVSIAIYESFLHTNITHRDVWNLLSLQEILIILPTTVSLKWLFCLETDGIRIFQPGVRIKQEDGWANAHIQNRLIDILVDFKDFIKDSKHTDRAKKTSWLRKEGKVRIPTINGGPVVCF